MFWVLNKRNGASNRCAGCCTTSVCAYVVIGNTRANISVELLPSHASLPCYAARSRSWIFDPVARAKRTSVLALGKLNPLSSRAIADWLGPRAGPTRPATTQPAAARAGRLDPVWNRTGRREVRTMAYHAALRLRQPGWEPRPASAGRQQRARRAKAAAAPPKSGAW